MSDPTTSSGYVSVRIKEGSPIFSKQKMKLNLPQEIQHLAVCNNWLVTLMSHNVLLRLFLLQPDRQDGKLKLLNFQRNKDNILFFAYTEVFLEKYLAGMKVSNLFLDPLGNHLLIALTPKSPGFTPELLYLHRSTTKPKKCDKFKDYEITAIAFNPSNTSDTTTGSILIGTSKGLIFEAEFGVDGDKKVPNNWKQVRKRWHTADNFFFAQINVINKNFDINKKLPNYLPLYGNRDIDGLVGFISPSLLPIHFSLSVIVKFYSTNSKTIISIDY